MVVDDRVRQRLRGRRPAAVAARTRRAGCGSGRSRRLRLAAACARRRRPPAWAARPAGRRRGSPPCAWRPSPPRPRRARPATPHRWVRRPRRRRPSTTIVTSPRTPSAAQAARSASPARRTSSWVLVSSRHTAAAAVGAERLGHRGERRLGAVRRLEEHHRALLVGAAPASRRPRSPALRGRKPSKQNRSTGSPETASAVSTADGPGHRGDRDAALDRGRHQPVARVGHRRHPGIGDQQHPLARLERLDQHRRCGPPRCPRSRTPPARSR